MLSFWVACKYIRAMQKPWSDPGGGKNNINWKWNMFYSIYSHGNVEKDFIKWAHLYPSPHPALPFTSSRVLIAASFISWRMWGRGLSLLQARSQDLSESFSAEQRCLLTTHCGKAQGQTQISSLLLLKDILQSIKKISSITIPYNYTNLMSVLRIGIGNDILNSTGFNPFSDSIPWCILYCECMRSWLTPGRACELLDFQAWHLHTCDISHNLATEMCRNSTLLTKVTSWSPL